MKRLSRIAAGIGTAWSAFGTKVVLAQGLGQDLLGKTGVGGSTPADASNQLPVIIGNIVKAAISVLGIVFLILLIYGGFIWMTARGEADKVDRAKGTITRAIIGLIIIVSAYAISSFVVSRIITAASSS